MSAAPRYSESQPSSQPIVSRSRWLVGSSSKRTSGSCASTTPRWHLGVVLAHDPDVLLLDEPTNHLDLDTIGWLEGWLSEYRGAALIVSHDRAFLDDTCRSMIELGKRSLRIYAMSYSQYVDAREADLERERALAERQQEMIVKTEDFIRRNIAGQKTKQAQSRRKMLEKLTRLERPEDVWADA